MTSIPKVHLAALLHDRYPVCSQECSLLQVLTLTITGTVEYAYNDFCIAEMAKSRGNVGDYEKYSQSSNNWKNMFNPDVESDGFHGFLAPRYLNETFGIQDPILCSGLDDLSTGNCFLNPAGRE
jgi:hypothetical protein